MPRDVPPHTTNKSAGRITLPALLRLRRALAADFPSYQIPSFTKFRAMLTPVLARLQSGSWEFRVEVAILGASLCTRRPASFVRGAQLAKSVRLIIFQRPFSRRLLSAPLYRQL